MLSSCIYYSSANSLMSKSHIYPLLQRELYGIFVGRNSMPSQSTILKEFLFNFGSFLINAQERLLCQRKFCEDLLFIMRVLGVHLCQIKMPQKSSHWFITFVLQRADSLQAYMALASPWQTGFVSTSSQTTKPSSTPVI